MRNTCQRPVSGEPGGSCWTGKLTEVASEGLLAPRAVDRVADGREGRDRLVLVVVLEENGQGPVAPHGVAHERGVRGVDVRELFHQVDGELLRDVVVHLPVLPLGLGGVDVESCARFCRVSRFCEFGGVGPRDGIAEKVGWSGKSAASANVDRSEKLSRSNLRAFPTPSSFPAHTNVRTTLSLSLCVCLSIGLTCPDAKVPAVGLAIHVVPPRRGVRKNDGDAVLVSIPLDSALLRGILVRASEARQVVDHRDGRLLCVIRLGQVNL